MTSQICSRSSRTPCAGAVLQRDQAVVATSSPISADSAPAARPQVGHAAGQGDDLGPAGHREQRPDLRGRHARRACRVAGQVRVEAAGADTVRLLPGRAHWCSLHGPWPRRALATRRLALTAAGRSDECNWTPCRGCRLPASITSHLPWSRSARHASRGRGVPFVGGRVSRHVVGVTLDNLEHLPKQCRHCVFWELAPHLREEAEQYGQTDFEKEAWVSSVLLEWGSCGRIVYVDTVPAGYALYAPPSAVPRSVAFPTVPVSADAVLLTVAADPARVRRGRPGPGAGAGRGQGPDAARREGDRGVRRRESRARLQLRDPGRLPALGRLQDRPAAREVAAAAAGAADALSWKEDVEAALEQLFGTVTITTAAGHAGGRVRRSELSATRPSPVRGAGCPRT